MENILSKTANPYPDSNYNTYGEFPFCWKCWQRHPFGAKCCPDLTVLRITIPSIATTGDKANSATDKDILTIIDYLQDDVLAENYENVSNYLESLRELVN